MKNSSKPVNTSAHRPTEAYRQQNIYNPIANSSGLADLQKSTSDIISHSSQWGFSNSSLNVKRYKLDGNNWLLTVVNPKTRKTILQVEGHGDTVFENEDNLARMAEILMHQGLTIRTEFDD